MIKKLSYRTALLCGCIGALLTLIGDILIGANPACNITTGVAMLDMFVGAAKNSDLRMAIGGLIGAIGIPITGIGYMQIYRHFKDHKGIMPKVYQISTFAYMTLAGAGVHLPCAVIPLLYEWIAGTDEQLAIQVAEKYANYFMMPLMAIFGCLLLAALVYQTIIILKGKTSFSKRAALYNMAIGVVISYILAAVIGDNIIGNAIGTGAISIGHLYMFMMFMIDRPKD